MKTYINTFTKKPVVFIKESRDYTLGKLTEWVHYEQKDCGVMKMESNAFYASFKKVS